MAVTPPATAIRHLNGAFRAGVLYLGPESVHDLSGSSFLSQLLITGHWVITIQAMGENSLDQARATHPFTNF